MVFTVNSEVTIQQAYAFTADAVRKRIFNRNKSITEGDFAWICSRNCEGTEQLHSEKYLIKKSEK